MKASNAAYGWWHHTNRNDLDKVDKNLIRKHLDIYAAYLKKLTVAPVLPQRFGTLGDALEGRLLQLLSSDAGERIGLRGLCAQASRLRTMLDAVDAAADRLAAAPDAGEDALDEMNARLKRLSRILIPVMSTVVGRYGHDPYGLTAQTTVVPGLFRMSEYAEAEPGALREMLWVELVRARNRVSDAIVEAMHVCAGV